MDFQENIVDILIIGHISLDKRDGELLKGGPPQYQIPIFVGYDVNSVDVLTSCHDVDLFPRNDILNIINIPAKSTTTYEFTKPTNESGDDRILKLILKAENLTNDHLNLLKTEHYDIIVISGIANEVNLDFIEAISQKYPNSLLAIDAQTLCRSFKDDGSVESHPLSESEISKLAEIVKYGVLKGSTFELPNLTKVLNNCDLKDLLVIKTNSGKSVELVHKGKLTNFKVDVISDDLIVDSTGSGDIFLATFTLELLNSRKFKDTSINEIVHISHEITKCHLLINGIPSLAESRKEIEKVKGKTGNVT